MILAIDFDDTIANVKYPAILSLREDAKEVINKLYDDGHYIIIWTCRSNDDMHNAELFLLNNGVKYHKINQHHPGLLKAFQDDTRKISADIYIDDKGIGGLPKWKEIYDIVQQRKSIPSLLDLFS